MTVSPLTAAVARRVLRPDHLSFLADGGDWASLRFPAVQAGAGWVCWFERGGVRVERSPHGPGLVRWVGIEAIARAGLARPELATRARALAAIGFDSAPPSPERLARAGLTGWATARELHAARTALVNAVVDAGLAALGEQLTMFGGAA